MADDPPDYQDNADPPPDNPVTRSQLEHIVRPSYYHPPFPRSFPNVRPSSYFVSHPDLNAACPTNIFVTSPPPHMPRMHPQVEQSLHPTYSFPQEQRPFEALFSTPEESILFQERYGEYLDRCGADFSNFHDCIPLRLIRHSLFIATKEQDEGMVEEEYKALRTEGDHLQDLLLQMTEHDVDNPHHPPTRTQRHLIVGDSCYWRDNRHPNFAVMRDVQVAGFDTEDPSGLPNLPQDEQVLYVREYKYTVSAPTRSYCGDELIRVNINTLKRIPIARLIHLN